MAVARGLLAIGVRPGEHVGILLPNRADFVESFFGVALCGAVAVLINARYRSGELAYVIENADLVAILTTGTVGAGDAVAFESQPAHGVRVDELFSAHGDAELGREIGVANGL